MIRPATVEDFDAMIALGRQMHAEGWYRFHSYDEAKIRGVLNHLLDHGFVIVGEIDGALDGYFLGALSELWFCRDTCASDVAIFVHPDKRGGTLAFRMVAAFIEWAHVNNASEISIASSCGVAADGMQRLMNGMGFAHVGGVFKRKGAACATG